MTARMGHDCPMAPTYATVDMDNYCGHPDHDRATEPRRYLADGLAPANAIDRGGSGQVPPAAPAETATP